MSKAHPNPFRFGDPVEGSYYLPRPELATVVRHFLENRIHVVLIGPRRFGKTSFALELLRNLDKQGYICLFVDIFNITSHKDFLEQVLRALREKKGAVKRIWDTIVQLRPRVAADIDPSTNMPSLGIKVDRSLEKDVKEIIQDVLAGLEKLGDKVVFVIDEFQKVTEIGDQGWLEATLRTHMQRLKNTSFLFTGSRRSIIYDMLNDPVRPLYRSCQPIEFPSFGPEFSDWVMQRFQQVGIVCDRSAVEHLRTLVQDTPNYVQMVGFHLVAQGIRHVTIKDIDAALHTVVRQNAYAYQTLLSSLSLTQQRALRLAAKEDRHIFGKEFLVQYEIASPAALASAVKALRDKGILEEENVGKGRVIFDDPLFALWLKQSFDQ